MYRDLQYNIGQMENKSQYMSDYSEIKKKYKILKKKMHKVIISEFEEKGKDYSYIDLRAVFPDKEFKHYEKEIEKQIEQMLHNRKKLDKEKIERYFHVRRIMVERKVTSLNEDNIETSANFTRELLKNIFDDLMLSKQRENIVKVKIKVVYENGAIEEEPYSTKVFCKEIEKKEKKVNMTVNSFN